MPFDAKSPLSPSNYCILPNYAFPIPTIIIEVGKFAFFTIISFVAAIS